MREGDVVGRTMISENDNIIDELLAIAVEQMAVKSATLRTAEFELLRATDFDASRLDDLQRDAGDGPTIVALRDSVVSRLLTPKENKWPGIGRLLGERGVRSMAAFPVVTDGSVAGVFSVYSAEHHSFGPIEIRLGRIVADQLAAWTPARPSRHLGDVRALPRSDVRGDK
jgi:GAF domain-containing protein